jgi:AcrR family transcriptional regulator
MKRDRDEILKAAARYFSRGGFRTTSMQDVAEALDVSRSSLYYHFTEKSDLLYEILLLVTEEFSARAQEIVEYPLSASQRLNVLLRAALKLEVDNPGVPLMMIVRTDDGDSLKPEQRSQFVARRDEYEGYYRRLIDEGIDSGEFRPVNTKLTTFALLGMLEAFNGWFDPDGPQTSDEIADVFADLFLAGLANDRPPGPLSQRLAAAPAAEKPGRPRA